MKKRLCPAGPDCAACKGESPDCKESSRLRKDGSMPKLSKEEQRMLFRILVAAALLIAAWLMPANSSAPRFLSWIPFAQKLTASGGGTVTVLPRWLFYLVPYAVAGWDVLWRAVRNLAHGKIFDENFLMGLATVGAFATAEYAEAVFVMLFYQVGELFQDYAVDRSRNSIASLMDIRPDYANLERDGRVLRANPEEVAVGDIIVVKPGERIPLDGTVLEGSSALDTAALTGESVPRDVVAGDTLISGCVNQTGLLRVRVTKPYGESTVSKILDLVENASEKKAASENFITKFARYYTPCVVLAAVALALIPPFFVGGLSDWFHRALIFLVISCPCALVLSVPLSFFGGIGGASRCGILVKGSSYLEALAKTEILVFDKTGTLTKGTFTVTAVHPEAGFTPQQVLEYAALAESYSDHPISQSLKAACPAAQDPRRVTDVEEIAGHGVRACIDGRQVCVGNSRLMERENVRWLPCELPGTLVHITIDGFYAGHIVISDEPKEDSAAAIADLKAGGIRKTVMLTGDTAEVALHTAQALGIDEFHAELLPADKVAWTEKLLAQKTPHSALAFVGDGINDAPVLTRADIGIAMGALGSDAAIEAADIVLMDDKPSKIATAMRISRKTLRIVHENIGFALGVKALVLILGAFGLATLWEAVFADVGVALIAVLNATRALHVKAFSH